MKNLQHTTNYRKLHKGFTVTNFDQKITFNADDEVRVVTLCNDSYASVTRLSDNQHAYVSFSKLYETSDSYDPDAEPEPEEEAGWAAEARYVLTEHYFYDCLKRMIIKRASEAKLLDMLIEIGYDPKTFCADDLTTNDTLMTFPQTFHTQETDMNIIEKPIATTDLNTYGTDAVYLGYTRDALDTEARLADDSDMSTFVARADLSGTSTIIGTGESLSCALEAGLCNLLITKARTLDIDFKTSHADTLAVADGTTVEYTIDGEAHAFTANRVFQLAGKLEEICALCINPLPEANC